MNSYKSLNPIQTHIKKKICILGGTESYKDQFQNRISSTCLSLENKHYIGVNISKIDYFYKSKEKFEFLLWNIDCGRSRAFLRTIFYSGSEALIIFISETKIYQINQYFDEIQSRIPGVLIIFCVILEKLNKKDDTNSFFKTKEYGLREIEFNVQKYQISDPTEIFDQISSFFLTRIKTRESEGKCIIDFILLESLLGYQFIKDECYDYFEPETHTVKTDQIANTKLIIEYIKNLDFVHDYESLNWINIKNEKFGRFSIYLKNGNVYYFPIICEICHNKKCPKFKKAPYFICIEAGVSEGWSNIKGLNQKELVILAKIIALKEGNESNLPESIVHEIKNINTCEKRRRKK